MSKATPHHHGHELPPRADHGKPGERRKGSVEYKSHDQHAGHSPKMFQDKFRLSLALTLPVVFWSTDMEELLGYRAPEFSGSSSMSTFCGT